MVGGYAVLIFVIVALEELLDTTEYNNAAAIIQWVELSILGIFVVEIVLGIYAWTMKVLIMISRYITEIDGSS